ncbi:MAG: SCP2 sterol-binding domain-containing protein [Deltaproteobacteria bacterium]|nr:SCP2 sterol-binding domain-containing protein [Deltaproteobacteria bacterium]
MAEYYGVTVEDIFNTMEERFRPDKAEGIDMTIGYDIAGEGGGKWTITVKDQTCSVKKGLASKCTVVMRMAAQNFVGLNLGKIDAVSIFTAGKVKIEGDMEAAGTSAKLFKRFKAEGAEEAEELIRLKCVPSIDQRFATGPIMGRFFAGLKERKFYANKCPKCGRVQIPPREICADCRVRCTEFVELGPKGNLLLLDICYYASPDPLTGEVRETPYAVAVVLLEGEGPVEKRESFTHFIKSSDIERANFGDKIRPVWAKECTGGFDDLLYFEIED